MGNHLVPNVVVEGWDRGWPAQLGIGERVRLRWLIE